VQRIYGRDEVLARARRRVASACAGQGCTVLFTGEPGGAPAYWPWIQIFRGPGMDADPFARSAPGGPESRFDAFDRPVRALTARAQAAPLALVLDDLHAADPPSLLLLLLLARQPRGERILIAGTYRDAELRLKPEVGALAKLGREAEVLPLPRLPAEDVADWGRDAEAVEAPEW
jgi:hypothetical protein